jgi:RNA polymerase primary sigma factor/RNA polymerase sigma factor
MTRKTVTQQSGKMQAPKTRRELVKGSRPIHRGPLDRWAPPERVERLAGMVISFIDVPAHMRKIDPEEIRATIEWQPNQSASSPRNRQRMPAVSADVARMCMTPLLTPDEEVRLFKVMNYLKRRASELSASLDPDRPTPLALVEEIESLLRNAETVRNHILRANLRLVVSIAKKFVNAANTFEDLVSEGNLSLLQAAEKYNFSLGNRFSTYATRAIRNNLFHYVTDGHKRRQRFPCVEDDCLRAAEDSRPNEWYSETAFLANKGAAHRLLKYLDPEKRSILESRFGLQPEGVPCTLKTLAAELGVSRERVRQIEARAIRELRLRAEEENITFAE